MAEYLAPWVSNSVVRVYVILVSTVRISDDCVLNRFYDDVLSLILDPLNEPINALVSDELVVISSYSTVFVDEVDDAVESEGQELRSLIVNDGDGHFRVLVQMDQ